MDSNFEIRCGILKKIRSVGEVRSFMNCAVLFRIEAWLSDAVSKVKFVWCFKDLKVRRTSEKNPSLLGLISLVAVLILLDLMFQIQL